MITFVENQGGEKTSFMKSDCIFNFQKTKKLFKPLTFKLIKMWGFFYWLVCHSSSHYFIYGCGILDY